MEQDQALQPLNVIDRESELQRIRLSQRCRPVAGISLSVMSALMLVASNLFAKLSFVIPVFEIGIIRFAIQLVVTIPTLIYSNDNVIFSPKITTLLVLRGFGGATSMITRFYASQNMPLGDATVLLFTTPVFVAILARIFLKERLHWIYSILLVLCLAGVTLIARPTFIFGHPDTVPEYNNILVPSLVALLSTVASACNTVVLRVLGKSKINSRVIIFHLGIVGIIYSTLGAHFDKGIQFPFCKSIDYVYALVVGVLTTISQKCVNEALRMDRAFIVSLARSSGIVFGFLFQIIIYSLVPSALSFGGASMIIICNIIIFFFNWFQYRKNSNCNDDVDKIIVK